MCAGYSNSDITKIFSKEAGQLFRGVIYKIKENVALYASTANSTLSEQTRNQH